MPPTVVSFHSWGEKREAVVAYCPFKRQIAKTINQSNTALCTINTIHLMPKAQCILDVPWIVMHVDALRRAFKSFCCFESDEKQAHINGYFLLQPGNAAAPTGNHDKTLLSRPKWPQIASAGFVGSKFHLCRASQKHKSQGRRSGWGGSFKVAATWE